MKFDLNFNKFIILLPFGQEGTRSGKNRVPDRKGCYPAVTDICRGTAFCALGRVRRSTPSSSLASILF